MKKLMILLAVSCLFIVSCNQPAPPAAEVAEETCCTLTPEQQEMFDNWEMWADLTEEQQLVLVDDMKTFMDECKAKCAEKCAEKEGEEVCPKKAEKCAEMKAKWEAFETLSLDEKKALIDEIFAAKKCCEEKEKCCKHEEKECDKE